jgi:hypothetical protein
MNTAILSGHDLGWKLAWFIAQARALGIRPVGRCSRGPMACPRDDRSGERQLRWVGRVGIWRR